MDGGSNAKRCRVDLAGPSSAKTWFGTPGTGVIVRPGPVTQPWRRGAEASARRAERSRVRRPIRGQRRAGLAGRRRCASPCGRRFSAFVPARHSRVRATGRAAPKDRHQNGVNTTGPCIINASSYTPLGAYQPAYWGRGAQPIRLPSLAHLPSFFGISSQ